MKTNEAQHTAFCDLTVTADNSCTDIISLAHSLYYYCHDLPSWRLANAITDIRAAFDKLGVAIQCAEELMEVGPRVATDTIKPTHDSVALCDAERAP